MTALATGTATVTVVPSRAGRRAEEFAAATRVEYEHGTLSVTAPDRLGLRMAVPVDVTVEVPAGSSCEIVTASADVRCSGELRSLAIRTASGDIAADRVSGPVEVRTASGDVRLGEVGELRVETATGDVQVGTAAGDVCVRTASGDVTVGSVAVGRTDITSASGDVDVNVAAGTGVYLDLLHPVRERDQRPGGLGRRSQRGRHPALPHHQRRRPGRPGRLTGLLGAAGPASQRPRPNTEN